MRPLIAALIALFVFSACAETDDGDVDEVVCGMTYAEWNDAHADSEWEGEYWDMNTNESGPIYVDGDRGEFGFSEEQGGGGRVVNFNASNCDGDLVDNDGNIIADYDPATGDFEVFFDLAGERIVYTFREI